LVVGVYLHPDAKESRIIERLKPIDIYLYSYTVHISMLKPLRGRYTKCAIN
jgi:hypothetical protein